MRNRAKCKKCLSIIESYTVQDYVTCKCGEIAIDGGNIDLKCYANDFANFMRIDDEGNEIVVTVKEGDNIGNKLDTLPPSRQELLDILTDMIKKYDELPQHAMTAPVTHYDLQSVLMLVLLIFKAS